jgi:hypothetical protein
MNTRQIVLDQLERASRANEDRHKLQVESENCQLSCQLTALDAIGCAFDLIQLRSDKLVSAAAKQLQTTGEQLAQRLNYLLEPIKAIEFDEHACILQLRSFPPSKDENAQSYYEMAIKDDGTISLTRCEKASGEERRQVPAHVTREMLVRLIVDLCDVAA